MTNHPTKFVRALKGDIFETPPIWFMRQAGRYLPEYREVRAKAGGFLDLCYNPELASEVTVQPIRRYGLDAAILFADILLVPQALGVDVRFETGEGPVLSPITNSDALHKLGDPDIHQTLGPVYETVSLTRKQLPDDVALIGFAGAPWTVATYVLAGGGMKDPASLRRFFYDDPEFMTALITKISDATIDYLDRQILAGADAIQLFDTWAGGLPENLTKKLSVEPMARIAEAVKKMHPDIPVILFPKGAGAQLETYATLDACDAMGIDYATPWMKARDAISPHATVQGGLDPLLVVQGGAEMEAAARELVNAFRDVPYVFNLGHGFVPETPPENVARLVDIVRGKS
ncbi:MAG: uroporphyrinogen decarboxylase [Pseudomonadota bacterium]